MKGEALSKIFNFVSIRNKSVTYDSFGCKLVKIISFIQQKLQIAHTIIGTEIYGRYLAKHHRKKKKKKNIENTW